MCKSLIFTEFSNIANQIAVKNSFRKQWPNGLYGIARTLNSASQPVKKRRALFSSIDSPSQGKRFFVQLVLFFTGADQGFFLGGGALVSCCTSTPINHIVFFFFQNTSCIRKPQVISGGWGGAHPLHPPPRSALALISADNGAPVARGKEPFLCSFLHIEMSKFHKDLLLFFLVIS